MSKDINVAAKDGVVTLTRFVYSYFDNVAGRERVQSVYGVQAVASDIEVEAGMVSSGGIGGTDWRSPMAIKKMLRVTARGDNAEPKRTKLVTLFEIINLKIDGDDYILLDERGETLGTFTGDLFENIQVELWEVGEITVSTHMRPDDLPRDLSIGASKVA